MEEKKNTPPPIIDQLKEYADTQIKLAKYEAMDQGSRLAANFAVDLIIGVCFVMAFFFLSMALAFVISRLLGSYWAGFGVMAGVYLIIALIIYSRKGKLGPPLANMFIRNFFK